jgi:hypothetical protein
MRHAELGTSDTPNWELQTYRHMPQNFLDWFSLAENDPCDNVCCIAFCRRCASIWEREHRQWPRTEARHYCPSVLKSNEAMVQELLCRKPANSTQTWALNSLIVNLTSSHLNQTTCLTFV